MSNETKLTARGLLGMDPPQELTVSEAVDRVLEYRAGLYRGSLEDMNARIEALSELVAGLLKQQPAGVATGVLCEVEPALFPPELQGGDR